MLGIVMIVFSIMPLVSEPDLPLEHQRIVSPQHIEARAHPTLKIPSFGPDYAMPIAPSATQAVVDSGRVGHFPGTGPVGKGNYALTAHVVTHGAPFAQLPELDSGDKIVVEHGPRRYEFEVNKKFVIDRTELWVLDPQPHTITLITCNSSLFHTDERLVVRGVLTDAGPVGYDKAHGDTNVHPMRANTS